MSSRLGDFLVRRSVITPEQLAAATDHQREHGVALPASLIQLGFVTETDLTAYLHREYRLPIVDPQSIDPSPEVIQLIPASLARRHEMLPISRNGATLTMAIADPSNLIAISEAKFLTGCDIRVVLASPRAIAKALDKFYNRAAQAYEDALGHVGSGDVEVVQDDSTVDLAELQRATEEAPVVKLVNALLVDAVDKRASDIHIEPYEKDMRVRFRIDGMLYDVMEPPPRLRAALISRIKIMATLDISERRLPQDGSLRLRLPDGKEVNFRISTLPTVFGEKLVLRLLDKSGYQLDIQHLGFSSQALQHFRDAIERPYGMILVTGPTGSGKTTTLYAALSEINRSFRNISTAEDPVELNIRGINQVQINEEIGLTFAAALRSFLRQDPDVIMVGEIRDGETAEIAIKAALTGHLVLSTLHTNDAPSSINRLLNMGVEPFLVSSSVNLIIAQRLVRLICKSCRTEVTDYPPTALKEIGLSKADLKSLTLYRGRGCDDCAETGYRGRRALYEILPVSDGIRDLILRRASAIEIKRFARESGMETLRECGLGYLREGWTSVEEILRVTTVD